MQEMNSFLLVATIPMGVKIALAIIGAMVLLIVFGFIYLFGFFSLLSIEEGEKKEDETGGMITESDEW